MLRELKLGNMSLLKVAASVTPGEAGLVTGRQVAAYVEERLSGMGGGSGSWNGGSVSNPVIFKADVQIGTGPPVWLRYSNTNAGMGWDGIPDEAVPTRGQIDEFVQGRTANTESWYEAASCPNTWLRRPSLPEGWYKVEVMLNSSNGDDALGIINASAVRNLQVKNVTGLAYGGTDNSSCPYTTWDGVEWYDMSSASVSRAMASVVRLDFIYCHYRAADISWIGERLNSAWPGWEKGVARYTGIRPPRQL